VRYSAAKPPPPRLGFILVDDKGENSIVVAAGANAQTTPAWLNHSAAAIRTAGLLVLQLKFL
jgi:sugar/nucleoside kinase (ribokinase family)